MKGIIIPKKRRIDSYRFRFEDYSPDLKPIFGAVGKAMGGRRLHPDVLQSLPTVPGSIVTDHEVTISHISRREAGTRRGHYLVTVSGPRINGGWRIRSGALEVLSRRAAI